MTVAEAAQVLGLTSDAIRAKIRRGTMAGFKADDDTWRVIVEGTGDATPTDPRQPPGATPTGRRQTATDPPTEAPVGLISHMQEEIAYLRGELAKRSQELATERERADVLTREALGRIEALTAGSLSSDDSNDAGDVADDAPPPWWRRWWRSLTGAS
jgi:hypothetical protein